MIYTAVFAPLCRNEQTNKYFLRWKKNIYVYILHCVPVFPRHQFFANLFENTTMNLYIESKNNWNFRFLFFWYKLTKILNHRLIITSFLWWKPFNLGASIGFFGRFSSRVVVACACTILVTKRATAQRGAHLCWSQEERKLILFIWWRGEFTETGPRGRPRRRQDTWPAL